MNYVYGGSFNPPTKAHKKIIEILTNFSSCENVIVLPVGDDYQKPYLAPFIDRYNMLKLLVEPFDHVIISDLENQRAYRGTLNSLNKLKETYKDLSFVIGSDQLDTFDQWIEYEKLLASYPFVIMQRDDAINKDLIEEKFKGLKHEFIWVPLNQKVSSTKARKHREERMNYLEQSIIDYIDTHDLYKE